MYKIITKVPIFFDTFTLQVVASAISTVVTNTGFMIAKKGSKICDTSSTVGASTKGTFTKEASMYANAVGSTKMVSTDNKIPS